MSLVLREKLARSPRKSARRRTRVARRITIAKRSAGRRWRGEDSLDRKVGKNKPIDKKASDILMVLFGVPQSLPTCLLLNQKSDSRQLKGKQKHFRYQRLPTVWQTSKRKSSSPHILPTLCLTKTKEKTLKE
jgi:hypothetical protein